MQGDSDDAGSIQDSLATLSSEISIKQKLVEQLEGAQKNMHSMRQQYEAKLLTLQQQISRTESERDRVLKELGEGERERGRLIHKFQMFCSLQLRMYVLTFIKCLMTMVTVESALLSNTLLFISPCPSTHQASCGNKLEDKAKEVKDQYTSELSKLQKELKQLKAAKKEHQKALKQQASTDRELKALKKDLEDMKKQRVKLMHKMRDEATRNRQEVRIGVWLQGVG